LISILGILKQYMGGNIVINVYINPEILAGLKLSARGKHFDMSLDRLLLQLDIWNYIDL